MVEPGHFSSHRFPQTEDELLLPQTFGGVKTLDVVPGLGNVEIGGRPVKGGQITVEAPHLIKSGDIVVESVVVEVEAEEVRLLFTRVDVELQNLHKEVVERSGSTFLHSKEHDIGVAHEGAVVVRESEGGKCILDEEEQEERDHSQKSESEVLVISS